MPETPRARVHFRPAISPRFSRRGRDAGTARPAENANDLQSARPAFESGSSRRQVVGVFAPHLTTIFADVLRRLGRDAGLGRAWDSPMTAMESTTFQFAGRPPLRNWIRARSLRPSSTRNGLGSAVAPLDELIGGNASENAGILEGILSGQIQGAKRDMAVVNAAAGFVVAGLARDMNHGIELAREQIDSGRALEKLRALQDFKQPTPSDQPLTNENHFQPAGNPNGPVIPGERRGRCGRDFATGRRQTSAGQIVFAEESPGKSRVVSTRRENRPAI